MSKKIGKVFKSAAKSVVKVGGAITKGALDVTTGGLASAGMGALSGGMDTGISDLAKTQAAIAQQQADQAAQEQRYQAQAAAQQIQLDNDRNAAQQAADAASAVDTTQVDVAPSGGEDTAAARRKRYNATSVSTGGASNGPAIRI